MKDRHSRLTELTQRELIQLQHEADELADLQAFLNKLPMGLQVEQLSDDELDRLRQVVECPASVVAGAEFMAWANQGRRLRYLA